MLKKSKLLSAAIFSAATFLAANGQADMGNTKDQCDVNSMD